MEGWDTLSNLCRNETIYHLFLPSSLVRFVWNIIWCAFNLCFCCTNLETGNISSYCGHCIGSFERSQQKTISYPLVILHMVSHWLNLWFLMQTKLENWEELKWGVESFREAGSEVFRATKDGRIARQFQGQHEVYWRSSCNPNTRVVGR